MKRLFAPLGLLSLGISSAASASYVDGMALSRYCGRTDPFHSRCTAYIAGVVDSSDRGRCVPEGTDIQVVARVVRDHLDKVKNPISHNAADLVKEALEGAYPCE